MASLRSPSTEDAMKWFKRQRNWGLLLLAIWLLVSGALHLGVSFPQEHYVLAALAIAAGVLILLER
jgi:hypothetical protein